MGNWWGRETLHVFIDLEEGKYFHKLRNSVVMFLKGFRGICEAFFVFYLTGIFAFDFWYTRK